MAVAPGGQELVVAAVGAQVPHAAAHSLYIVTVCAGFEFFGKWASPFCKWLPKAVHYLLAVPFLKNGHRLWLHNSEECLPRGGASSVKGAADSIVLVLQTALANTLLKAPVSRDGLLGTGVLQCLTVNGTSWSNM